MGIIYTIFKVIHLGIVINFMITGFLGIFFRRFYFIDNKFSIKLYKGKNVVRWGIIWLAISFFFLFVEFSLYRKEDANILVYSILVGIISSIIMQKFIR